MPSDDKPFRVRVIRQVEAWEDVRAKNALSAELALIGKPGIVHVFPKSAVLAIRAKDDPILGVEEE